MSEVEIDLHGYTWEEACQRFFHEYEAVRTGERFTELVVIHGVGSKPNSGVIRDRLRQLLLRHQDKLDFQRGADVNGNDGRTIVRPRRRPWGGTPSPPIAEMSALGVFVEVRSTTPLVPRDAMPNRSRRRHVPLIPQKGQLLRGRVIDDDGQYFAMLEPWDCLAEIVNAPALPVDLRAGEKSGSFYVLEANKEGAQVRYDGLARDPNARARHRRKQPQVTPTHAEPSQLELRILAFCKKPRQESQIVKRFRPVAEKDVKAAIKSLLRQAKLRESITETSKQRTFEVLKASGSQ